MSQGRLGADVDKLQEIARDCETAANVADTVRMFLQALVAAARAFGPWSEAFIAYIAHVVIPWLIKVAQALRMFARVLNGYASAQIALSDGKDFNFEDLPRYVSPIAPIGPTPPGSTPPLDPVDTPDNQSPQEPERDEPESRPQPQRETEPRTGTGGGFGGGGGAWTPPDPQPQPEPAVEPEPPKEEEPKPVVVPIVVQQPQTGVGLGPLLGGLAAATVGGGLLGAAITHGVKKKLARADADDGSGVLGTASLDHANRAK